MEQERRPPQIHTSDTRRALIDELLARGACLPLYFKMRMVAKGPFVGMKVCRTCNCTVNGGDESTQHEWQKSCDRHPHLASEINGHPYPLERALKGGQLQKIEESEYRYLIDAAKWDVENDPDAPLAAPTQAVNFNKMRPIF